MKKYLLTIVTVIICCAVVGTTFAWLVAETDPLVNTFTVGDVNITLEEGQNLDLKMVPGKAITKDPKVTVLGGSEACWLFVKLDKSANFDNFMEFTIVNGTDGWTELTGVTGVTGVYYREVAASNTDQEFGIISNNTVTVKSTVTKANLETANAAQPKLTFTAYAVQSEGITTAAAAWNVATTGNLPTT